MDKRIKTGEELTSDRLIDLALEDAAYTDPSLDGEGIDGARAARADGVCKHRAGSAPERGAGVEAQ